MSDGLRKIGELELLLELDHDTYLLRSLSGRLDLAAFSQMIGTLSGYLSLIFFDSAARSSKEALKVNLTQLI